MKTLAFLAIALIACALVVAPDAALAASYVVGHAGNHDWLVALPVVAAGLTGAPLATREFGRKDAGGASEIDEFSRQLAAYHGRVSQSLTEVGERLTTLEQKGARSGGQRSGAAGPGWGHQVAESPELDGFRKDWQPKRAVRIGVKTITSLAASGGALAPAAFRDEASPMPRRVFTVRDLLNIVPVETGSVDVPRQTTRTIGAATVAEGAAKPESDLAWELVNVPVRTIAHWVLAARQVLSDAPQLENTIDTELRYGLQLVEEGQILTGGGTGTDLNGIYTQATAFSAPFDPTTAVQEIDVIGLALLQADNTDLVADGIAINPTDWMKMRMLKDADGKYILGDPQASIAPMLFGRPVAATKGITAGTFLVGPFKAGATLYERQEAEVLISTEDSDNFRKNLVTILAEERVALSVKRPTSFIKGTFATIITALNA